MALGTRDEPGGVPGVRGVPGPGRLKENCIVPLPKSVEPTSMAAGLAPTPEPSAEKKAVLIRGINIHAAW